MLHRLETDTGSEGAERLANWLRRELPGFLTRDDDRALFADLLATPAEPTNADQPPA